MYSLNAHNQFQFYEHYISWQSVIRGPRCSKSTMSTQPPTYEETTKLSSAILPLGGSRLLTSNEPPPKYTPLNEYLQEKYNQYLRRKQKTSIKDLLWTLIDLFLSVFVFVAYLVVVLGCVTRPLKNLYFVHFDVEHASYVKGVSRQSYNYDFQERATLVQQALTSTESADFAAIDKRRKSSRKELESDKLDSKGTFTVARDVSESNPSLLLPTRIPYLETYMGYFGALPDNATYVSGKDLYLDQSYFAGVWVWAVKNYDFYSSIYLPLNPGLNISQKMNEYASTSHLNMVGLNYLPDEFPQRSTLLKVNNVFKALQPFSAVSLLASFIFLLLSTQLAPGKVTLVVSMGSLCIAIAFNVLYTVVSTSYASTLSKAFCFKEVPVRRGTTSIILLWTGFASQALVSVLRVAKNLMAKRN